MGKRKIGELRNIPIVEGDKNLVREGTEIHINDLQTSGSSGGESGGVKEYYCRVANEIPEEIRGMLVSLLNMVLVSSILISDNQDDFTNYYKVTNAVNRDGTGAPLNGLCNTLRAFSYLDSDTYLTQYGMDRTIKLSGNIFNKFLQYGGEESESLLPMIEPYLQEITKEEYESLITQ